MSGAGRRPLHEAYAVCPPGVEQLGAAELRRLGVRAVKAERGGVSFRCTTRQLYAANLWSRLATRVVVRAAAFEATTFAGLETAVRNEVDLDPWLGGRAPRLRVSASRSALYHTEAIAERLRAVWGEPDEEPVAGGRRPDPGGDGADDDVDEPADDGIGGPPLVIVRAVRNRFTVSVDCSGTPLYKRGWRQAVARAPLRENLAAAMVASAEAAGWTAPQPLVDPFCGSGTIAIEAALSAIGRPPGFRRGFAFFEWPTFEPGTWASVIGQAVEAERAPEDMVIVGSDRDAGAVAAATANAERAEVADIVRFEQRPVSELGPPAPAGGHPDGPGWVLTNPPYGARIDHGGDLRNLYGRFGAVARERLPGWSVGMLVADRRLAAHTGLSLHDVLQCSNGGIDVTLLVARV